MQTAGKNISGRARAILLLLWVAGCSTPEQRIETPDLREVFEKDRVVSMPLVQEIEQRFAVRDPGRGLQEFLVFTRKLAERLTQGDPRLEIAPVGVILVQGIRPAGRALGVPGNRIYLAEKLLRELPYENELAAVLALELAHLATRDSATRLANALRGEPGQRVSIRGLVDRISAAAPESPFSYTDQERLQATGLAVQLLYRAGYDSRGVVTFLGYAAKNGVIAPDLADKMKDRARAAIVEFTPLLHPLVRTDEFLRLQARVLKK